MYSKTVVHIHELDSITVCHMDTIDEAIAYCSELESGGTYAEIEVKVGIED